MRLLAVETATEACSAAIWQDGDVIERFELAPRRHTELILPMVNSLMAEAELSLKAMDALVFGHGPGSFTGVRIATGVIQGLALSIDRPVIGISTLASLAQTQADDHAHVCAVIDARMQEVYWGCYQRDGDGLMQLQGEERVCAPAEVPGPSAGQWLLAGSGWASYSEALGTRLGDRIIASHADAWPRAGATARLAVGRYHAGDTQTASQARPVYLRDHVTQGSNRNP